jgi:phosphoglycolate phosphatase
MALLALFDVDGTLFLTHDPLSSEALLATLRELYSVDPPDDAVERIDHVGQTAKRIARLVLRAEGLDDAATDVHLDEWCSHFGTRYVELLERDEPRDWQAAPGAGEALGRLGEAGVRLALLTGNPEPMARARMAHFGLDGFFPEGQGAFGCDREGRDALIGLARHRAGGWPADQTVEVGDTLRDVETAHSAGVRSIAVRSGRTTADLADADALCDNLAEVTDRLLAWNGR